MLLFRGAGVTFREKSSPRTGRVRNKKTEETQEETEYAALKRIEILVNKEPKKWMQNRSMQRNTRSRLC